MRTINDILKNFPKIKELLLGQNIIWNHLISNNDDIIYILPTGYGKSLLYQMYALSNDHWGIVISPLISLMKDQVGKVNFPAIPIHSEIKNKETKIQILKDASNGKYKLLYISPERLSSISLQAILSHASKPPSFIVVDEVHCLTEWGRDFRLDYLRIRELADRLKVRLICCTATAGDITRLELVNELKIKETNILNPVPHERNNLNCIIKTSENFKDTLQSFENDLDLLLKQGQGMVFVISPNKARELAKEFSKYCTTDWFGGIDARDETGKLRPIKERTRVQENWLNGTIKMLFCTSAFGMGIDKPDVHWVAHLELPPSLEAYWQQIGRSGRDGLESKCIVYSCNKEFHQFYFKLLNQKFAKFEELMDFMCEGDMKTVSTGIANNPSGDLETRQLLAWIFTKHKIFEPLFEYIPTLNFEVPEPKEIVLCGERYSFGKHRWKASKLSNEQQASECIIELFYNYFIGNIKMDSDEEQCLELRFKVNKQNYLKNKQIVLDELNRLYHYKKEQIENIKNWNNNNNRNPLEPIYAILK